MSDAELNIEGAPFDEEPEVVKMITITPERLQELGPQICTRISKQIQRWFEISTGDMHFPEEGLSMRLDNHSPPEWELLAQCLYGGSPTSIEAALSLVEKVLKRDIKRRRHPARLSL